jgi:hypothetical protein
MSKRNIADPEFILTNAECEVENEKQIPRPLRGLVMEGLEIFVAGETPAVPKKT